MQNAPHRSRFAPRNRAKIAALTLAVLTFGGSARADVALCAKLHADGQREAKAGHLRAAAEHFAACGSTEGCPDTIVAECAELYRETQTSTPTAIFAALDAEGTDLTEVKVYAEDTLLQDGLNGRAIPLDPGKYTLRFEFPSGQTLSIETLVREGEKNRIIAVRLPSGAQAATAPRSPEPTPNSLPASFWIGTGVGAAALASFGVFAVLGSAKQSRLDQCSPQCPPERRDDFDVMRRDFLVADISLGVGAVSLGAAAWIFIASHSSSRAAARPRSRVSFLPAFSPEGTGLLATAIAF